MFHKTTNIYFYATHAKVLSCLMLVLFYLLLVNVYLLSLKINISYSTMVAKSFNSSIALGSYIITICISITGILATQVLLKSSIIELNRGPKNHLPSSFAIGT